MTDFTSDTPVLRARSAPPKREYYAYFAIIFLAALPLATLTWALGAARRFEMPEKGPLARAWARHLRLRLPHKGGRSQGQEMTSCRDPAAGDVRCQYNFSEEKHG